MIETVESHAAALANLRVVQRALAVLCAHAGGQIKVTAAALDLPDGSLTMALRPNGDLGLAYIQHKAADVPHAELAPSIVPAVAASPDVICKLAMSAIVLAAGGTLTITAADLNWMPEGDLTFEGTHDGGQLFTFRRSH